MPPERHLTRWDDFVLRIIAIYHLLKALFFFALALGIRHFLHHDINVFLNDYVIDPFKLDPDGQILRWIHEKLVDIGQGWFRFFSYVFAFYGLIFAIEGIGLYLRKRWAEYMVVIVVSSLLPFEIYEICLSLAVWKFVVMAGNLAVVAFLIHRLRIERAEHKK